MQRLISPPAKIDLNPMLDVVFIMLIFFVVTAVFVKEQGIDLNPPEPSTTPPPDTPRNILVRIDGNNRISVQSQPSDVRLVEAHLRRLLSENAAASVAIDSAPLAQTQTLVAVLDAARASGAQAIRLVE